MEWELWGLTVSRIASGDRVAGARRALLDTVRPQSRLATMDFRARPGRRGRSGWAQGVDDSGRGRALTAMRQTARGAARVSACPHLDPLSLASSCIQGGTSDAVDDVGDTHSPSLSQVDWPRLCPECMSPERLTLGAQPTNPHDFNALNFLDPI